MIPNTKKPPLSTNSKSEKPLVPQNKSKSFSADTQKIRTPVVPIISCEKRIVLPSCNDMLKLAHCKTSA